MAPLALALVLASSPAAAAAQMGPASPVTPQDSLWLLLDEALETLRAMEGSAAAFPASDPAACTLPSAEAAERESLAQQADARRRDPGLAVEAGIRSDFEDQPLEDGPGAYVGLSLDVFQSGYFQNRRLSELFRIRSEAAAVRAEADGRRQANRCLARAAQGAFDPLATRLLEAKLASVQRLTAAFRESYLSGVGHLDEVLNAEQELARSRSELASLRRDAGPAAGPAAGALFPRAVDLDMEELGRRLEADEYDRRLLELRIREARVARDGDDDTRLRLYLRYGVRPNNVGRDDQGISGGVTFRMPLFQGNAAGLDAEIEAARRRTDVVAATRREAARDAHEAFRTQLTRVFRQHYLYLESFERVRRSRAGRSVDREGADLALALGRLVALYNAAIERSAALRALYGAAAQVLVAAEQPFDDGLLRPIDLPDVDYRGRSGSRTLYAWSDAFNRYDNGYLLELARTKGISRFAVSVGQATMGDKLERFRAAARAAGIGIELVLSTNAWLDPDRRGDVAVRIAGLDLVDVGLHLDVEPQALDAFRTNPDSLLAAYLDVVERAREAAGPAVELALSVPVDWPVGTYARLAALADRLYLMAYASTDPQRVTERIAGIAATVDPGGLVLALRASDFDSEWESDLVFTHAAGVTGVSDGAIHDLAGFMAQLDRLP